jgi:hypothetical protein
LRASVRPTNGTSLSGTGKSRVAVLLENKLLLNAQTQLENAKLVPFVRPTNGT